MISSDSSSQVGWQKATNDKETSANFCELAERYSNGMVANSAHRRSCVDKKVPRNSESTWIWATFCNDTASRWRDRFILMFQKTKVWKFLQNQGARQFQYILP